MTRLYRQVAAQIADLIETGEFHNSQRLPAERHLSARLSVSRPTIREAIIALEISGLVDVRAGSGVYIVNTPTHHGLSQRLAEIAGASPTDVINARVKIECAIIGQAAQNASNEQLDQIAKTVDCMDAATNRDQFDAADKDLHVLVAKATGNSVLGPIVEDLWMELKSPLFDRLGRISGLMAENEHATLEEHRQISQLLRDRDAKGAEAGMRIHLLHVRDFLQRDWTSLNGSNRDIQ